jgi:nucleolar complex protein 2
VDLYSYFRLLPSSRYFPLRFHILHSLIRLIGQTGTYIPLSPFLLEILDSSEFKKSNPKKSSLKPLDFEYIIRAPAAYQKTRIFQESLGEELTFLLGEYHSCPTIANSIAFPELVLPVIVMIKRHIKKNSAGSPKVVNGLKGLVEKLEGQRVVVENKRRGVGFAPRDRAEVGRFEEELGEKEGPLAAWMRLQRKVREARRREVERALREERVEESESEDE